MKLKYYLRGFGTGVIFATVILIIALAVHDNLSSNSNKNASSGNLLLSTENNNKQTEHNKESVSKKEDPSGETSDNKETSMKETQTTIPNETTTQIETTTHNQTTIQNETTTQNETTKTLDDVNDEVYTLSITSGMTSNQAADILAEHGIVDSGYDFNMYLYNNGYESKIRTGKYKLTKGMSYAEIAKMITR